MGLVMQLITGFVFGDNNDDPLFAGYWAKRVVAGNAADSLGSDHSPYYDDHALINPHRWKDF